MPLKTYFDAKIAHWEQPTICQSKKKDSVSILSVWNNLMWNTQFDANRTSYSPPDWLNKSSKQLVICIYRQRTN